MKKKFLSWLLIGAFLAALFPLPGMAATTVAVPIRPISAGSDAGEAAKISLEKAIQSVKQNFTIPSGLTEFTSSFDHYGDRQRWILSWTSKDEEEGNFRVEVDAATGEIVGLNRWSQPDSTFNKTPSLSVVEAKKIGSELLARLLPGKVSSLTLQDDSSLIPLGTYESPRYTMNWKRNHRGINVAMDNVHMEIDMQTGEVINYNLNWTNKAFANPQKVISADQARQAFVNQEILKLQYFKTMVRGQQADAKLIYGIRHPSNGMIDAFSGQPLAAGGYLYNMESAGWGMRMKLSMGGTSGAFPVVITPEEQKEIDSSARYISQAKAMELVKKWIPIADDMKLQSAALEKDWQNPDTRCWRLSWSNDSPEPEKNSHVWAQVDAVTGELTSFNLNLPPQKKVSNTDIVDQKAAQLLAESFIRTIQPKRWSEVKLDEQNSLLRPLDINPPTWSFSYVRLVNGIICPDNGIEVAIDTASKQVTSYRLNWSKDQFPSARGAMDSQQANQLFLQAAPLTLNYTMVPDFKGVETLKLVYMPQAKEGFSMIDALNGEDLNSEGKAITNTPRAYVFNDIKGHFGEKEISLLGQAGILGEYDTSFHPDENIKLISLLRAMLTAKQGVYSTRRMNDEEILQRCRNLNWIEKNTAADSNVSREFLAQLMIRFLNIDYLSQAQGIYQLSYQDAKQMPPRTKAYAALCWGLGIIKADGKTFNPEHTVSRAEAAVALVNTLSIKTQP